MDLEWTWPYFLVACIIIIIGIVIGVFAFNRAYKNTSQSIFGNLPGLHLVLAFVAPWVEIICGSTELIKTP